MSSLEELHDQVTIICPHCEYENEADLQEVSVCQPGDTKRSAFEGITSFECEDCGERMTVIAHLDLEVEAE